MERGKKGFLSCMSTLAFGVRFSDAPSGARSSLHCLAYAIFVCLCSFVFHFSVHFCRIKWTFFVFELRPRRWRGSLVAQAVFVRPRCICCHRCFAQRSCAGTLEFACVFESLFSIESLRLCNRIARVPGKTFKTFPILVAVCNL